MKIGKFNISNKKIKDLPSKFKRFVEDEVFPMSINIELEDRNTPKEMCKIVDKKTDRREEKRPNGKEICNVRISKM